VSELAQEVSELAQEVSAQKFDDYSEVLDNHITSTGLKILG